MPRKPEAISAIILHNSGKLKWTDYVKRSLENEFMIHFFVDAKGEIYGDPKFLTTVWIASPGIDEESIHIAYEGSPESLTSNTIQKQTLAQLVQQLSESIYIPKSNFDIVSKKGIFTHNQAKRRFGGFVDFSSCGGEPALKELLLAIEGTYFEEENWKDRFESGWVLKKRK